MGKFDCKGIGSVNEGRYVSMIALYITGTGSHQKTLYWALKAIAIQQMSMETRSPLLSLFLFSRDIFILPSPKNERMDNKTSSIQTSK